MKYFKSLLVSALLLTIVFAEIPTRVVLNIAENPAHEMAISWRTYEKSKKPAVKYVIAEPSTKFSNQIKTLMAEVEKISLNDNKECYQYSVFLKNLEPNTTYAYQAGEKNNWTEWNQFQTACESEKPFEFVYLGDVQNSILDMSARVLRNAYSHSPKAAFWLYAGDIVNSGGNDNEWGELFESLGWIAKVTPMAFLPGNHEYPQKLINNKKTRNLTELWRPQFALPENGVEGLEESNYFFNYQGVKVITLNGNEKLEEQAEWLEKILKTNNEKWTIVSIHQPFYSTAQGRDSQDRRDLFLPIFDKYGVDLVLQGHDHAYGRTYKMKNNQVVSADQPGTYYVVSVVGIKVYDMKEENRKYMAKMGNGKQLFQIISIDGDNLTYKSYDALGELFDEFVIIK